MYGQDILYKRIGMCVFIHKGDKIALKFILRRLSNFASTKTTKQNYVVNSLLSCYSGTKYLLMVINPTIEDWRIH